MSRAVLGLALIAAFAGCRGADGEPAAREAEPAGGAAVPPAAENPDAKRGEPGPPPAPGEAPPPGAAPEGGSEAAAGAPEGEAGEPPPPEIPKVELSLHVDEWVDRVFRGHPEKRRVKEDLLERVQAYAGRPNVDAVLSFEIVERELYPGRTIPYAQLGYRHLFLPGSLKAWENRVHEWWWDRSLAKWR